eukprot:4968443-Lingulodinium_polyedra.AAC.1
MEDGESKCSAKALAKRRAGRVSDKTECNAFAKTEAKYLAKDFEAEMAKIKEQLRLHPELLLA